MRVKTALSLTMQTILLMLGTASTAIAQDAAAAGATIYQELGWLILALVLGYGVIARRSTRTESEDAGAKQKPIAAGNTEVRPTPDRPLRLIDLPAMDAQADVDESPAISMPKPKKTA